RAEMTVLGASAGLQADDAFDLYLGTAPAHPHLVGEREQFLEPVLWKLQHLEHLVFAQPLTALEHLLAGHRQNVGQVGRLVDAILACVAGRSSWRLGHRVPPAFLIVSARVGSTSQFWG